MAVLFPWPELVYRPKQTSLHFRHHSFLRAICQRKPHRLIGLGMIGNHSRRGLTMRPKPLCARLRRVHCHHVSPPRERRNQAARCLDNHHLVSTRNKNKNSFYVTPQSPAVTILFLFCVTTRHESRYPAPHFQKRSTKENRVEFDLAPCKGKDWRAEARTCPLMH